MRFTFRVQPYTSRPVYIGHTLTSSLTVCFAGSNVGLAGDRQVWIPGLRWVLTA